MIDSTGRKISNFPAGASLPSDSYLTYVSGGVNYKIDLSSFQTSLGVTGTLSQAGAVTSTPVLDVAGTDYVIRNLEAGTGISATVSAENGISLGLGWSADTTGAPILLDPDSDTPVIASIVAGDGISATSDGDTVVISSTDTPVATKTVIVSQVSDFPASVAGVITLEDDREYLIVNDITVSDRFELGASAGIRGGALGIVTLTYTGTDAMFTGDSSNFRIFGMRVSALSGSMFDMSGAATILQVIEADIKADTLGSVVDGITVRFDSVSLTLTTGGLDFGGTIGTLLATQLAVIVMTGTFFNLDTAVFTDVLISDVIVNSAAASSIFLSGSASSANIAASGIGTVTDVRVPSPGDTLNVISRDDIRWRFISNTQIEDTHAQGFLSISGNTTETTIAATNTPVKAAGTFTVESESQFTGDTTGRITYDGEVDLTASINFTTSILMASGTTDRTISVYVAINGSVVATSGKAGTASNANAASITGFWQHEFTTGDYVEIWVENQENTINIELTQAVLIVG